MSDELGETQQNGRRAPQPLRLGLPGAAVKTLAEAGIYCHPVLTLGYQSTGKRYVLRGVESGGAVREVGHYVLFCDENGRAIPWLQPLQSIGANGLHAVVIAPELVSVEIFRVKQTYRLLIANHAPHPADDGRKPRLRSEVIFRGRQGYLSLELWGRDREAAGRITPEFFTRAGERQEIPSCFICAVMAATKGATFIGCDRAQYAHAPETSSSAVDGPPKGEARQVTEVLRAASSE
jgi:hypothetical protein